MPKREKRKRVTHLFVLDEKTGYPRFARDVYEWADFHAYRRVIAECTIGSIAVVTIFEGAAAWRFVDGRPKYLTGILRLSDLLEDKIKLLHEEPSRTRKAALRCHDRCIEQVRAASAQ